MAIDDEQPALEKLASYIRRVPYLELVATCDNAVDATRTLAENPGIDAMFVDINMPDLNGLDFVNSLDNRPLVVFITAYPRYALDSYGPGAVDYLLKPYSFEQFLRAAGRLVERHGTDTRTETNSFFVKTDSRWVKIRHSDVEYIRGYGDYLRIFIVDHELPIVTYSTLSAIKAMLPAGFIQVHRSFIVNIDHINVIERGHLSTPSNSDIPIGDSFKDTLAAFISTRSIDKEPRKQRH